jgi:uncharacterized protein (TIGR03437 family)
LGSATQQADGLYWTDATPTVTVNGIPAQVVYSGLCPDYVGLYQVNVLVPAGTNPADVTLSVTGATQGAIYPQVAR